MEDRSSLDIVAEVLGRLPSGCSILTTAHAGRTNGMLASWIQQASFQPLLLSIAIGRRRPILELLEVSRRCVLNLLGPDPKPMFRHFARGFSLEEYAFAGLQTRCNEYGVILEHALGYLECMIESRHEAGDHWLYVVRPERGELLDVAGPYVHIRKSADTY